MSPDPDYTRPDLAEPNENAKAVNASAGFRIDDAIDAVDTRSWLAMGLANIPSAKPRKKKNIPTSTLDSEDHLH